MGYYMEYFYSIRIKYLGYDNKWHYHYTKWCDSPESAWKEEEKFLDKTDHLESNSGLRLRKVLKS